MCAGICRGVLWEGCGVLNGYFTNMCIADCSSDRYRGTAFLLCSLSLYGLVYFKILSVCETRESVEWMKDWKHHVVVSPCQSLGWLLVTGDCCHMDLDVSELDGVILWEPAVILPLFPSLHQNSRAITGNAMFSFLMCRKAYYLRILIFWFWYHITCDTWGLLIIEQI